MHLDLASLFLWWFLQLPWYLECHTSNGYCLLIGCFSVNLTNKIHFFNLSTAKKSKVKVSLCQRAPRLPAPLRRPL